MSASAARPTPPQQERIDAFADATYDLLHARAQSIGILDISLDVDAFHVDCELMFSSGPDLGFSLDTSTGECRYCELLDGDAERWLEEVRGDLHVLEDHVDDSLREAAALELLDGLLAARRPLLRDARSDG